MKQIAEVYKDGELIETYEYETPEQVLTPDQVKIQELEARIAELEANPGSSSSLEAALESKVPKSDYLTLVNRVRQIEVQGVEVPDIDDIKDRLSALEASVVKEG